MATTTFTNPFRVRKVGGVTGASPTPRWSTMAKKHKTAGFVTLAIFLVSIIATLTWDGSPINYLLSGTGQSNITTYNLTTPSRRDQDIVYQNLKVAFGHDQVDQKTNQEMSPTMLLDSKKINKNVDKRKDDLTGGIIQQKYINEKLGLRWRDLGHEIVSGIKDKYHGTKNNVDRVKDEARRVATNVVDKGLETKNEIVSNVKDGVEKGNREILETIENNEEWIAKTSHVVNEGLKEKLASVRENIVDGTKGVEQNGIDSGNVAKGFTNKQGVALKGKVHSVVNNLEHKMKDIDNNIHKQGASTSQKRLEDYASTVNPTPELGHRVADKVGDKYKYVEGKIVETYQDGKHNSEGLGHSMLLEGRIGCKVDALVENDKRLNAKLERTMIETYEGVIGKATKLGQNVLGIVGDTYKDAKVKEKELDKNQRYEQAFEKGGEYIDKAKGKVYEGYEKGAKIGHDIGDKILDKYEKGMETTQSYVHNMKNNIHAAKESIEAKIRHGQDKYENDNAMSRQDLASKSRQVSHNVKMKTLKGIRDQVNKINDKAQNHYDLEVDDERDNFYINQYGNTQEVDHVGFLESLGGGKGIGLLEKFNQMTDGIRDRTKEHEQKTKKAIKKGAKVAKHITEEGGKKTQENYQNVNDRVVEGGCEVANVVRDTTSQAQEGYKFMTDEITNNGNNVDDSLKGFGQNLAGSTKETSENLKGASSQENLCKPTTTSFEDYRYPNDEPLALGTKINEEHVEALHSLGQPKHVQSVIHLSQPEVCLIDPIVDGKLEGPLTDSATIVEIGPVIVSDPDYVEMDSKNQNIHSALETYEENSYQDAHFKAGFEDIPQTSQENESIKSCSWEKEVASEEEQGCTYQDVPPT